MEVTNDSKRRNGWPRLYISKNQIRRETSNSKGPQQLCRAPGEIDKLFIAFGQVRTKMAGPQHNAGGGKGKTGKREVSNSKVCDFRTWPSDIQ